MDVNVKSPLLDTSNDCTKDIEGVSTVLEAVDVDGALEKIGNWGKFNILLLILLTTYNTTIYFQLTFSYFIGNNPPWKCVSSPGNITQMLNDNSNMSTMNSNNNVSNFCTQNPGKEVHVDDEDFYKRCHLPRDQWTYSTDKTYSYTTEFDLVCGKSMLSALVSSAFFCGLVINIFVAPMADIFGRRKTLIGILFIGICASISSSYVTQVSVKNILSSSK